MDGLKCSEIPNIAVLHCYSSALVKSACFVKAPGTHENMIILRASVNLQKFLFCSVFNMEIQFASNIDLDTTCTSRVDHVYPEVINGVM